jgi:23S rRNA pseudouridine1911/1915/1917 synthase
MPTAPDAEDRGQAAGDSERRRSLVVPPGMSDDRLDVFVARGFPDLSRARAQQLVRGGFVHVDGKPAKPSTRVMPGQRVDLQLPPPAPAAPQPEPLPLDVLFDDADIAVVNKPAGLVVHPAAGHASGTLVNALLHHVRGLSGIGGAERPGIVHRLDRGTSGVMVVAKHDRAHRALSEQFQGRTVTKEYVALVWGHPSEDLVMDRPIGRDPRHRQKMSGRARRARTAITRIITVEPLDGVSLVRVAIGTGRTHQIRVHLSEAGFPIVGDALYGGERRRVPARLAAVQRLGRPFLHAARLAFAHPADQRPMSFEAPLPDDLAGVLVALQRAAGQDAPEGRPTAATSKEKHR